MDYIVIQLFFPSKTAAQSRFKLNSRYYDLIFLILVNSLAAILVNSKVDRCLQGEDLNASLHGAAERRETPLNRTEGYVYVDGN